jgi:phage-related protein
MEIRRYTSLGTKDVIKEFVDSLPNKEQEKFYCIEKKIEEDGLLALMILNTRKLEGKLWEIKIGGIRIMYIVKSADCIYFLHICKKQSMKTRRNDKKLAINRGKECGLF